MNDIAKPEDVKIWRRVTDRHEKIKKSSAALWAEMRLQALDYTKLKVKNNNKFGVILLEHGIDISKHDRSAYLKVGKMTDIEFQKSLEEHPNATSLRGLVREPNKKLSSPCGENKKPTTKPDEVDELNEFIKAIPPKTIDKRKLKAIIKKHVSQAENKLLDNLDAQKQHVVKLQKESEDMRQTYSDLINENALYSSREFKAMISPNHPDNGGSAKVFALLMRIKRFVGK